MIRYLIVTALIAVSIYLGVISVKPEKTIEPPVTKGQSRVLGEHIITPPIIPIDTSITSGAASSSAVTSAATIATPTIPVKKSVTVAPAKPKISTPTKSKTATAVNAQPIPTTSSGVVWSSSGLRELRKIPAGLRPSVKKKITNYAIQHGIKIITAEVYNNIHI